MIAAATASLGEGMPIRRALPTAQRRLIGAWCFLDHFGPADVSANRGMRVGPHPHIGLQTVTWLIEGEVLHRDSLGSLQPIRPGALNLMTAGRGISHSEESPEPHPPGLHGLQFWIALPEASRHTEPAFAHYPAVPATARDGLAISVFAGRWLGLESPAAVHTPLVGAWIHSRSGTQASLPLETAYEHGVVVAQGEAQVNGERLTPGSLLYLPRGTAELRVGTTAGGAGLALVGGVPLEEPVLMWWNFVARTKDELTRACRDWNAGAAHFGEVRGYDGPRLVAPMPPWAGESVVNYP